MEIAPCHARMFLRGTIDSKRARKQDIQRHVHRSEGHRPQRVRDTYSYHQSPSLQGDSKRPTVPGLENIAVREEASYSPNRILCDFLPMFKWSTKRIRFEYVEAIKTAVRMKLRGIPEEYFQQWIEACQRRTGR